MIKAQELRIGNLVQWGEKIVPIKSIHTESVLKNEVSVYVEINEKLPHYCLNIAEINPIPLTEEWFNRFEFENDTANGFIKDSIHIEYIAQVGYLFFINGDVNGESIKIEYVHDLQNLFFALRKQELEMKGGSNG